MIGYDLDGVLVPDLDLEDTPYHPLMNEFRCKRLKPLFVPSGEFVIITGRPISDHKMTSYWVEKNLPGCVGLWMNDGIINDAVTWKVSQINLWNSIQTIESRKITTFIESDDKQVDILSEKCYDTHIVHFSDFITSCIGAFNE
jgi:hypothetical protein